MKTEYQVRADWITRGWADDLDYILENYRKPGVKLFRREVETPEEAAVRRMAALDKNWDRIRGGSFGSGQFSNESMSEFADRLSPPPARNERQVDWDTLEPIEEAPVWQFDHAPFLWVAGIAKPEYYRQTSGDFVTKLTYLASASIGHTRESALRNFQELQSIKK